MNATAEILDESVSWSTDRISDVVPINLTIRLWSIARDRCEAGDAEGARDAALDATVVWAVDPSSLDEELLIELLQDTCGVEAEAILASIRMSPALAAWKTG